MPDIFDTSGVDLDQYLGTRNSASGVQDKDLINRIKAILGPFVLRRVKSDVMKQLVAKTHEVRGVVAWEGNDELVQRVRCGLSGQRGCVMAGNHRSRCTMLAAAAACAVTSAWLWRPRAGYVGVGSLVCVCVFETRGGRR